LNKRISTAYFFLLLLLISFSAFSQGQPDSSLTSAGLKALMAADSNLVILDVRTVAELEGDLGQIPNVINIPLQQLSERIGELEKYKKNKIAVICRSGNRSRRATKMLTENGYNAINVTGGMIEWRNNGY